MYVSPYMTWSTPTVCWGSHTDPFQTCPQAPVAGAENERFLDVPPWVTGPSTSSLASSDHPLCADLFCPARHRAPHDGGVHRAGRRLDLTNLPSTPSFTDVASAWYTPTSRR